MNKIWLMFLLPFLLASCGRDYDITGIYTKVFGEKVDHGNINIDHVNGNHYRLYSEIFFMSDSMAIHDVEFTSVGKQPYKTYKINNADDTIYYGYVSFSKNKVYVNYSHNNTNYIGEK